jgi:hypothetical protein
VTRSKNSPAQIVLVDLAAILLADDGIAVDLSREATAQLNTTPDAPATAATVYRSFFQENLVGIRALRTINWLRGVDGSVVYMTVSY